MSYFDSDSDEMTKRPKYNFDDAEVNDDTEDEPETLSAVIALEVQSQKFLIKH